MKKNFVNDPTAVFIIPVHIYISLCILLKCDPPETKPIREYLDVLWVLSHDRVSFRPVRFWVNQAPTCFFSVIKTLEAYSSHKLFLSFEC